MDANAAADLGFIHYDQTNQIREHFHLIRCSRLPDFCAGCFRTIPDFRATTAPECACVVYGRQHDLWLHICGPGWLCRCFSGQAQAVDARSCGRTRFGAGRSLIVDQHDRKGCDLVTGCSTCTDGTVRCSRRLEACQELATRTIGELKAAVAQQQKQIEALTAGLQKVTARVEAGDSALRVVSDN